MYSVLQELIKISQDRINVKIVLNLIIVKILIKMMQKSQLYVILVIIVQVEVNKCDNDLKVHMDLKKD